MRTKLYLIESAIKKEKYQISDGVYLINAKNKRECKKLFDSKKGVDEYILTIKVVKPTLKSKIVYLQHPYVD